MQNVQGSKSKGTFGANKNIGIGRKILTQIRKKDITLKCDSHSNKHVSNRPPYIIVDLNAILGVPKGSGELVNDYMHLNDLLLLDKYSLDFFL